ncbi:ribonuclease BN [Yinghuangia sp. ASG 101]|uniref:ribonuclease BN n=1 Tax=Yinghuangia sp. ASG 101 TaxID=2896848 RepID=UPI001E64AA81|nr:ribonuclease BN [Yinghuangia sp. ASG 101]UGQ12424.1 ribonuclease BN [Yinghuangia sp. ASG 101]
MSKRRGGVDPPGEERHREAGTLWRRVFGSRAVRATKETAGRCVRRALELELMHRAMGFAALGLVTLLPLLIVVAAANPLPEHVPYPGFGGWIVDAMGISGRSAESVQDLFTAPRQVLSATSAFSLAVLALFGLSFATGVQTGYEKVWRLSVGPWHKAWRGTVWLAVLAAYLFGMAASSSLPLDDPGRSLARVVVIVVGGWLFFWWSQHFLLAGRVPARFLAPGAIATMGGLVGLRLFSAVVFAPLIVSNAVTYGAVGTLLMVESWLIGAGFVVFGGALVGRELYVESHGGVEAHPADADASGGPGDTGDSGDSGDSGEDTTGTTGPMDD